MVSKIIMGLGAFVIFFPGLIVLLLHAVDSKIPTHVGVMTRMLISVGGLGICLIGIIPVLFFYNRPE